MEVCSLFSGIHDIDHVFKQVGFDIVWENEIDKDAQIDIVTILEPSI